MAKTSIAEFYLALKEGLEPLFGGLQKVMTAESYDNLCRYILNHLGQLPITPNQSSVTTQALEADKHYKATTTWLQNAGVDPAVIFNNFVLTIGEKEGSLLYSVIGPLHQLNLWIAGPKRTDIISKAIQSVFNDKRLTFVPGDFIPDAAQMDKPMFLPRLSPFPVKGGKDNPDLSKKITGSIVGKPSKCKIHIRWSPYCTSECLEYENGSHDSFDNIVNLTPEPHSAVTAVRDGYFYPPKEDPELIYEELDLTSFFVDGGYVEADNPDLSKKLTGSVDEELLKSEKYKEQYMHHVVRCSKNEVYGAFGKTGLLALEPYYVAAVAASIYPHPPKEEPELICEQLDRPSFFIVSDYGSNTHFGQVKNIWSEMKQSLTEASQRIIQSMHENECSKFSKRKTVTEALTQHNRAKEKRKPPKGGLLDKLVGKVKVT